MTETSSKNLIKLYLNVVGILTGVLYGNNIRAVLDDERSVNLGSVYECVVATEFKTRHKKLYYYDNRNKGEVEFLVDDYDSLSVLPIEVKSGKDYSVHSALNNLLRDSAGAVGRGCVLSNSREVKTVGNVVCLPVCYCMFI